MSKPLLINDSWVLERAGKFSASFSNFLTSLTGGMELSSKVKEGLDLASKITSEAGLKELGVPDFVRPLVSKVSSVLSEDLSKRIQAEIDASLKKADKDLTKSLTEATETRQKALSAAEAKLQRKTRKLDERLTQIDAKLANIEETVGQRIASRLFSQDLKSLTNALYVVAKERGITNESVLYLIKMLPEFEVLMYYMNVRKFYRDHTAHSLRVAVLGDFLLTREGSSGGLESFIQDHLGVTKAEARTAWWFSGLLHDIGTPLEKLATSVNWSLVNEILRCYPNMGIEVSPLRLHIGSSALGNQAYLPILLKGLPKDWQALIKSGFGTTDPHPKVAVYPAGDPTKRLYQPQKPKMDHGVVAGLTLLHSIGSPERVEKEQPEDRPLIEAARAIAMHNYARHVKEIPFDDYPLLFLLVLADELQEWGRPIPVSSQDGFFTTNLEKTTLLDSILYNLPQESWDVPYSDEAAKKLIQFDFNRLIDDKQKALHGLDCSELYPETEILLLDYNQATATPLNQYSIHIRTQT
ncbi:MAG: hypothetical protein ACFE8F_07545 [Promethearchaeota archaeon]